MLLVLLIVAIVICGLVVIGDVVVLAEGDPNERLVSGINLAALVLAIVALSLAVAFYQ